VRRATKGFQFRIRDGDLKKKKEGERRKARLGGEGRAKKERGKSEKKGGGVNFPEATAARALPAKLAS